MGKILFAISDKAVAAKVPSACLQAFTKTVDNFEASIFSISANFEIFKSIFPTGIDLGIPLVTKKESGFAPKKPLAKIFPFSLFDIDALVERNLT